MEMNLEATPVMITQVSFAIQRKNKRQDAECVILLGSKPHKIVPSLQVPEVVLSSTRPHLTVDIHAIVALMDRNILIQTHTEVMTSLFTRSTPMVKELVHQYQICLSSLPRPAMLYNLKTLKPKQAASFNLVQMSMAKT